MATTTPTMKPRTSDRSRPQSHSPRAHSVAEPQPERETFEITGVQAPSTFLERGVTTDSRGVFNSVLLVEDHRESAEWARSILEQCGLEVHVANDGGQLHQLIPIYRPGCIITELILPGESGFELCEWAKQEISGIPVVVLTDVDLESARQLARNVGADAYVTKPVTPQTLKRVLDGLAKAAWSRKHAPEFSEDASEIRFRCRCGKVLKQPLACRGKSVTCPDCHDRRIVPQLSTHEMLCVGPEPTTSPRNEQEQFWRVTTRFVTVKCRQCATYFRLFSSDRYSSKICPKCQTEQSWPLSIAGTPLSQAALTSSLRVLKVMTGKHRGKQIMLPRHEVLLGSGPACEIRRHSCGWSDQHCALRPSVEGVIVRDLGSQTGTIVNGKPITQETVLPPGGLLRVGNMWFRLVQSKCPQAVSPSGKASPATASRLKTSTNGQHQPTVFEMPQTASQAAKVTQEYWEACRQRALRQLNGHVMAISELQN